MTRRAVFHRHRVTPCALSVAGSSREELRTPVSARIEWSRQRLRTSPFDRCLMASPRPSSVSWYIGKIFEISSAVPPRQ